VDARVAPVAEGVAEPAVLEIEEPNSVAHPPAIVRARVAVDQRLDLAGIHPPADLRHLVEEAAMRAQRQAVQCITHGRLPPPLHARLARRAPWAAQEIAPRDSQRIVRALELLDLGELEQPQGPNQLWTADMRHPTRLIGLVRDREELYARIDARVDEMIAAGAATEVQAAHAAGASETARKALGFEELLAGDVDSMKRHTRNFARRQLTWMRKLAGVEVIDITGRTAKDVAEDILQRVPLRPSGPQV
jgi:tRNA A37 N6-isopentenylltransferase MiaA